jgi:type VI secretion system protein ImpA
MSLSLAPSPGEIERLLAPISEDAPAGVWLRFEPAYDEIKRLREEDDSTLPQGVWKRELKRADWPAVTRLCSELLEGSTKDLQIAVWLTEAWLHLHGLPGFERGLRLLAALCRIFWPSLHPALEDGAEARLAPIAWAADKLLLPLKQVLITAPASEDGAAYGWKDWEEGLYLANLARLDAAAAAKAQEQGMVPQAKFMVSVSLTPAPWFAKLASEAAAALAAAGELEAALAESCGEAVPSLTPLKTPLVTIQAFACRVLEERGEAGMLPMLSAAAGGEEAAPEVPETPKDTAAEGARSGRVSSRSEAYQRLAEAADYLLRTEPHSPVPYLIRRAVSWGNLSLAELLQELLQKNADLPTLYTLLGIKPSS